MEVMGRTYMVPNRSDSGACFKPVQHKAAWGGRVHARHWTRDLMLSRGSVSNHVAAPYDGWRMTDEGLGSLPCLLVLLVF